MVDMEENQLLAAAERGDLALFQSLLCQENIAVIRNNRGCNPLDIAIERDHDKIAEYISCHQRCWEFLHDGRSDRGLTQLQMMVETMPKAAEKFLDRCVEQTCDSKIHDETQIKYNFLLLCGMSKDPMDCINTLSDTLKVMVKQKHEACLAHPVCVAHLKDFWIKMGFWLFLINFVFYMIFLSCLTSLALLLEHRSKTLLPLIRTLRWVVIVLSSLQLLGEIMQITVLKWQYFTRLESWFKISLYTISISSIVHYGEFEGTRETTPSLRGLMALSVFLAFSNILLYMRSSFVFGTYIVIMFAIIKTLIQIVILLIPFICAYGIPFYIIFSIPENSDSSSTELNASSVKKSNSSGESRYHLFDSVPLSIWTTFMLLIGEMKYPHTLYKYQPIPFPLITYCIYITMVLCMPIIVKNLLIGLSVGDIKRIVDHSKRSHLFSQVERLIDIEAHLPTFIRRKIFVDYVIVYPFRVESLKVKCISTGFPTITALHESTEGIEADKEEGIHHMESTITTLTERIKEQDDKISEILRILRNVQNSNGVDAKDFHISIA